MPKPAAPFSLTVDDHLELESWCRTNTLSQHLAQRAKILLIPNEGETPKEISDSLQVSAQTVFKCCKRYRERGLNGRYNAPRPGQPGKLDFETVKIINDPHPVTEKVCDVVWLYMPPPDNTLVLPVDEKIQIQAFGRTQPKLQLRPGQVERHTHDYKRNCTTSQNAASNTLTERVIGRITQRHRANEFLDFLRQIDSETPKDLDLRLTMDYSSTHKTSNVKARLTKHSRFKLNFMPTSASSLNALEGWFGELERRALYRGIFTSVGELKSAIKKFIKVHNEKLARPFRWHESAESIIKSVARAKLSLIDNK